MRPGSILLLLYYQQEVHKQLQKERLNSLNNSESESELYKSLGKPDFLIRMHLSQNASWQGEVRWLNTDQLVYFRSLLELIALMQSAIEISGLPETEYSLRCWKKEELTTGSY